MLCCTHLHCPGRTRRWLPASTHPLPRSPWTAEPAARLCALCCFFLFLARSDLRLRVFVAPGDGGTAGRGEHRPTLAFVLSSYDWPRAF